MKKVKFDKKTYIFALIGLIIVLVVPLIGCACKVYTTPLGIFIIILAFAIPIYEAYKK